MQFSTKNLCFSVHFSNWKTHLFIGAHSGEVLWLAAVWTTLGFSKINGCYGFRYLAGQQSWQEGNSLNIFSYLTWESSSYLRRWEWKVWHFCLKIHYLLISDKVYIVGGGYCWGIWFSVEFCEPNWQNCFQLYVKWPRCYYIWRRFFKITLAQ